MKRLKLNMKKPCLSGGGGKYAQNRVAAANKPLCKRNKQEKTTGTPKKKPKRRRTKRLKFHRLC